MKDMWFLSSHDRINVMNTCCFAGVEDHKGWSPLGRALYNLHTFEGRLDVGLYLINFGCGNDNDKAKLLFGACQWGRLDVVKELVEQHKLDPAGTMLLSSQYTRLSSVLTIPPKLIINL